MISSLGDLFDAIDVNATKRLIRLQMSKTIKAFNTNPCLICCGCNYTKLKKSEVRVYGAHGKKDKVYLYIEDGCSYCGSHKFLMKTQMDGEAFACTS